MKQRSSGLNSNNWKQFFQSGIEQYLHQHVQEFYPEIGSNTKSVHFQLVKYHTHMFSVIFEYDIVFQNGKLPRTFVKLHRASKEIPFKESILMEKAKKLARTEYQFHKASYDFFLKLQRPYRAVRPLAYQPEINALYVEEAPGVELSAWMSSHDFKNDPQLKEQAIYYFFQSGEMAREFHRHFRIDQNASFDAERQMELFRKQIVKLRQKKVEPLYLQDLEKRLQRNLEKFAGERMELAKIHGDYKLQHIFVKDDRLTLIDFGNDLGAASPYVDTAAFYVEIITRPFATFRSRFKTVHHELLHAFLEGYFGSLENESLPWLMEMHIIYYLLKKWNRRIKRFSHNSVIKQFIAVTNKLRFTRFIHYHYTNPWFMRQIETHLRKLERL